MTKYILSNYRNTNWIDFYILLGNFAKSLRKKNFDDIELCIIEVIYHTLCFAKQNDIDMNNSWNRWKTKVNFKNYFQSDK